MTTILRVGTNITLKGWEHYEKIKDAFQQTFTVKRKRRRWPLAQFYNIVDVCGIAAKVIWMNLYPNWNQAKLKSRRKLFLNEVVTDLVVPNILMRSKVFLSKSNVGMIGKLIIKSSYDFITSTIKQETMLLLLPL